MDREEDVLAFLRGDGTQPGRSHEILVFLGIEPGAKPSKAALEVLGKVQILKAELGYRVQAISFVADTQRDRQMWTRYGIDTLHVAPKLEPYSARGYQAKLQEVIAKLQPEIFLFPDEPVSFDLAPRLAQALETICVAGAREVAFNDAERLLEFSVETYGGKLAEVWIGRRGKLQIGVLKRGCFSEAQKDPEFLGQVEVHA